MKLEFVCCAEKFRQSQNKITYIRILELKGPVVYLKNNEYHRLRKWLVFLLFSSKLHKSLFFESFHTIKWNPIGPKICRHGQNVYLFCVICTSDTKVIVQASAVFSFSFFQFLQFAFFLRSTSKSLWLLPRDLLQMPHFGSQGRKS